jgi:hypothetical protein
MLSFARSQQGLGDFVLNEISQSQKTFTHPTHSEVKYEKEKSSSQRKRE